MGVEAFSVSLDAAWPSCLALEYMAHVPNQGDTSWFKAPARIGTIGSSKFVEGVAFRLAGSCADQYTLKYNCHLKGLGDQTMVSSRAFCGTRGEGRPLEAFVVAENLLDARYEAVVGYPALGRLVRGGLRLSLGGRP